MLKEQEASESYSFSNVFIKFIEKFGLLLAFLVVIIIFSLLSPYFFTFNNWMNIFVQTSIISIIAVGETIVILTGGIDLSVGSNVALVSMIIGLLMISNFSIISSLLIGIITGLVLGLVNGILVSYGKVPAFITTLGMMSISRGVALALNGGRPVSGLPTNFEKLATIRIGGIHIFVFYSIIVYLVMYVILNNTRTGRYIYAVGGNEEAARLSGIKVEKTVVIVYMLSGLFASIGGILLSARLNYCTPLAGEGYELDAIAASVIGGAALSGGVGNVWGTLLGSLLLGALRNGLTLLNVSTFYQQVIIGIVIILAVLMDKVRE